jgi:hypothetical protein
MRSRTAVHRGHTEAIAIEGDSDEPSRRLIPVSWAWLDLNQRPHPERRIARVSAGAAAPRRAELGRATRFSSLVAAPGHGGLISYRGLSAVRTGVFLRSLATVRGEGMRSNVEP